MDMMETLIKKAKDAMDMGNFNEIELTDGNLKVRLVRFTPVTYINSYMSTYQHPSQS